MTRQGTPRLAWGIGGVLASGLLAAPALATNGYFANGYGGGSKGMAGAGVAVPTGVLGLAQNPAFGTRIGNSAGFCLTTFAPDRSISVSGAGPLVTGTQKSKNDVFFIPCGGASFQLEDGANLAFFAFGNGGLNTEYDTNIFSGLGAGSSPLGVNLEQLFLSVNYSRDLSDTLSFGIGPILAIQRFSATGLEPFAGFSADPGNVTNNGDDWSTGGGVNLGLVWEPNDQWRFGFAYRSRIYMEAFNKYTGLFAEQGDFDIPAVATLGAAYTLPSNPDLTLTAEYQRIFYGDINAIANSNATLPAGPGDPLLGDDDGPGFGWKDVDVVRIGAMWKASDRLTLRGGTSYATKFIDDEDVLFNVLAPATPRWHVSVGMTYQVNDHWGLTASYTHAFDDSVTGSNNTPGLTQPVTLRMDQNEVAVGMTYRW